MTDPAQPARAPLRWKRAASFAIVVGAIFLAIAWAPVALQMYDGYRERKAAEPQPIPANDAEQQEILAALLTGTGWPKDLPRTLVDATLPMCGRGGSTLAGECPGDHFLVHLPLADVPVDGMPLKLRQELVLANRHPLPLADPGVANVAMISAVEIERMFADGVETGWERFDRAYPASDGFERYSIAVLTPDRREAMILRAHSCGGLCGSGALIRLERLKSGWHVVAVTGLWVS